MNEEELQIIEVVCELVNKRGIGEQTIYCGDTVVVIGQSYIKVNEK